MSGEFPEPADADARRGWGFVALYALAWGGGVVAYAPLLTLILPVRIEAIAPGEKIALLSLITLVGALVASAANILAGIASDRTVQSPWGRRPWVAAGLVLTLGAYVNLALCDTPGALIVGVMLFQVALNLMLGALGSIAADEIPDAQKGVVSGAMTAASAIAALAGIAVTASPDVTQNTQLGILATLVVACLLPFLLFSRRRGAIVEAAEGVVSAASKSRRDLVRVWIARLLIQICGSILFSYLLFYVQTVNRAGLSFGPKDAAGQAAWLAGLVTVLLIPLAILVGRLSDKSRSRRPFLVATGAMVVAGLLIMALTHHWVPAIAGYVLFSMGVGLFLFLQNAYAMQLLATPGHRGRDMGVLNLTNTIPSMIAPMLAYLMARSGNFDGLLLVLAGLSALAAGLMTRVGGDRTHGA